nr:immunoglobulin heavy chain junction region [Mus musculus]
CARIGDYARGFAYW